MRWHDCGNGLYIRIGKDWAICSLPPGMKPAGLIQSSYTTTPLFDAIQTLIDVLEAKNAQI